MACCGFYSNYLKTIDGGNNWSIQSDNLGYWLRAVFFTDANHGYAVGDHGIVLKTTDGGSLWNPIPLPGNLSSRDYRSLYFMNTDTGLIVGGHLSNDSIQTILKTTDGGSNWNIIADNVGPMLNGIDFADASIGYAVGNGGTVLKSTDAGDTWALANVPAHLLNDSMYLNAVSFFNTGFGVIVGKDGMEITYADSLPAAPVATTLPADITTTTSTRLNGTVEVFDATATAEFQYGITTQLENTVAATPDTVSGNGVFTVSDTLSGLVPNTFYYYRLVASNEGGYSAGEIKQFYTADCEVTNCDFEIWDTLTNDVPHGWEALGHTEKVPSYNGTNAVQLSGNISSHSGVIHLGTVGDEFVTGGGIPFHSQPDSFVCFAKYDIVPGDTGFFGLVFKLNEQVKDLMILPITGNSNGNFVRLSYPLHYSAVYTPDTLIFLALSSNGMGNDGNPASTLIIDDLQLPGAAPADTLPNSDFENWEFNSFSYPEGWFISAFDGPILNMNVAQVSDRVTGLSAVRLQNNVALQKAGFMFVGNSMELQDIPAFPVAGRHQSIHFYLKFLPVNNDTFQLRLMLFKQGQAIGSATVSIDTAVPNYTGISADINYSTADIPDSAQLAITTAIEFIPHGNSVAYIDNISFDSFHSPTDVPEIPLADGGFRIYPNPAHDHLMVEWNTSDANKASITFTDINGRLLKTVSCDGLAQRTSVDIADLPGGFYLVSFRAGNSPRYCKLVVGE